MVFRTIAHARNLATCLAKAFWFRKVLRVTELEGGLENGFSSFWIPQVDAFLIVRAKTPILFIRTCDDGQLTWNWGCIGFQLALYYDSCTQQLYFAGILGATHYYLSLSAKYFPRTTGLDWKKTTCCESNSFANFKTYLRSVRI
jgi:hypothetical protein